MKTKSPYSFRLYVPPEKENTVKQFIEICKRENSSASENLLQHISQYVDFHKHGNPQTLLQSYQTIEKTLRKCEKLRRQKQAWGEFVGWCSRFKRWVTRTQCENCDQL